MKHLFRTFTAVLMAVLVAALLPAQVFAESPAYISEVKIGIGSTSELEKDGYTILKDKNGKAIDINTDAGGGYGSEGDQAVYLGYKTTTDKNEAITDLALMNMKGGYSVQEYEALMETQMKSQIIPFVDGFLAAIQEYRENYNSENKSNRQRAVYIHDILDKFLDDDTGKGLGELLLNETKYEMGDKAYDALSDEEKQNHADILTIIAQSNGKATLMLENLITRAADTADDTWLDRFAGTTYDDLLDVTDGRTATDKAKKLAKQYDDKASDLLDLWEDFRDFLLEYDSAAKRIEKYDESTYTAAAEAMAGVTENTDAEKAEKIAEDFAAAEAQMMSIKSDVQCIAVHDALEAYDYLDGTLLDFFTMETDEIEADITLLYPLVASLSEGQLAGMEFVSLKEMMAIAMTDETGYSDAELDAMPELSIYDGVDRGIYQKGGVALTSDALRADAANRNDEEGKLFSGWSIAMMVITGASFLALVGSGVALAVNASKLSSLTQVVNRELNYYQMAYDYPFAKAFGGQWSIKDVYAKNPQWKSEMESLTANTSMCKSLTIGFGVAMIALTAVTTYLAWKDMHDYYKVDFTPIPHYMVDEKDLVGYNKKGERIILKNQSAYYKAVESTMKQGDFKFDEIGNLADLNGCVGKQWLALYAAKTTAEEPILASSLKVVINSAEIPSGYETGLHMFGSSAAFNLNDSHFDWNDDADSVYVYFQRDDAPLSTAGTGFSGGTLAIGAVCGLVIGVLGVVLAGTAAKKRKAKAIA